MTFWIQCYSIHMEGELPASSRCHRWRIMWSKLLSILWYHKRRETECMKTEHNLNLNVIGWVIGLTPPSLSRICDPFQLAKFLTNCGPKPLTVRLEPNFRELVSSLSTTLSVTICRWAIRRGTFDNHSYSHVFITGFFAPTFGLLNNFSKIKFYEWCRDFERFQLDEWQVHACSVFLLLLCYNA